jgi:hypothetical protein
MFTESKNETLHALMGTLSNIDRALARRWSVKHGNLCQGERPPTVDCTWNGHTPEEKEAIADALNDLASRFNKPLIDRSLRQARELLDQLEKELS